MRSWQKKRNLTTHNSNIFYTLRVSSSNIPPLGGARGNVQKQRSFSRCRTLPRRTRELFIPPPLFTQLPWQPGCPLNRETFLKFTDYFSHNAIHYQ
uniref:Uncharacterized protein n=1 Tax=Anguilla anguilla TaxID=7936 RepID=A0A0E9WYI5_ANGAN